MAGLGTAYVELELDRSKFDRSLQKLEVDAKTMPIGIEDAFKSLGIKSAYQFDLMREKAVMNFDRIKNASNVTANDIIRAEQAKNSTLARLQEEQFGKQTSLLQSLKTHWLAASAAIYASVRVVQQAWDMANQAADFQERAETLDALGRQAGLTGRQILEGMQEASSGLISMSDAANMAASALNLSLSPQQMLDFTRVAERLTDVIGGTVPEAFNRLTVAAASGRTQTLAQMGVLVDLDGAYKRFAASTGRTVDSLTDIEKQQIRVNEILTTAKGKVEELGERTDSTADTFTRAKARWEDLKLALGEKLAPIFTAAINVILPTNEMLAQQRDILGDVVMGWQVYESLTTRIAEQGPITHRAGMLPDVREQLRPGVRAGAAPITEADRKAEADAIKRNAYAVEHQIKGLEEIEKARTEFSQWQSEQGEKAAKSEESRIAYGVDRQIKGLEEIEKARTEFSQWETEQAQKRWEEIDKAEQIAIETRNKREQAATEERSKLAYEEAKERERITEDELKTEREAWEWYYKYVKDETKKAEDTYQRSFFNMRGITTDLFGGISTGMSTAIRGVIQGTQSLEDAFKRMGENVALGLVDSIVNRGIKVVADSLMDLMSSSGGGAGGILGALGSLFGGMGSSLWDWAGSALEGAGSFLGLLQKGMWEVPDRPGLEWAILHPGEMVLPPDVAASVRGAGGVRGGDGAMVWSKALAEAGAGAGGPAGRGPTTAAEAVISAIAEMNPGYMGLGLSLATAFSNMYGAFSMVSNPIGLLGQMYGLTTRQGAINAFGLSTALSLSREDAATLAGMLSNMSITDLQAMENQFGSLEAAIGALAADVTGYADYGAAIGRIGAGAFGPGNIGGFGSATLVGGWGSMPSGFGTPMGWGGWQGWSAGIGSGPTGNVGGSTPDTTGGPKGTEGPDYANGALFNTARRTEMIVGEAGPETVAVLRNPRKMSTGGLTVNGPMIQVQNMTVRKESDIAKINEQLGWLVESAYRRAVA